MNEELLDGGVEKNGGAARSSETLKKLHLQPMELSSASKVKAVLC